MITEESQKNAHIPGGMYALVMLLRLVDEIQVVEHPV